MGTTIAAGIQGAFDIKHCDGLMAAIDSNRFPDGDFIYLRDNEWAGHGNSSMILVGRMDSSRLERPQKACHGTETSCTLMESAVSSDLAQILPWSVQCDKEYTNYSAWLC